MKKRIRVDHENIFFLSIGDLMTGLLFIFILLFLREYLTSNEEQYKKVLNEYTVLKQKEAEFDKVHEEYEELKKKEAEYDAIIKEYKKLKEQENRYKDVLAEYEELKIENDKYRNQDKKIEEIYEKIETKLKNSIKDNPYVKIDTYRQELVLDDSVLFDVGEWTLKPEGQDALRKVLPKFFSIFLDEDDVLTYLEQLIIEGHTDDTGPGNYQQNYLYNLNLSQKRALEVVNFIYRDEILSKSLNPTRLSKLRIYLSSNGKSNSELIYKKDGSGRKMVDRDKSRRVTIKYKLDIQKIRGVQKKGENL